MLTTKKTTFYALIAVTVIASFSMAIFFKPSQNSMDKKGILLQPHNNAMVKIGRRIYTQHCAACHGIKLEGQPNWRVRLADGKMPAPPHDETGHTWHHPDHYLFGMTKYGIEAIAEQEYPNNMPVYQGTLSDDEIIAALSYIKSTWPKEVQDTHDEINTR